MVGDVEAPYDCIAEAVSANSCLADRGKEFTKKIARSREAAASMVEAMEQCASADVAALQKTVGLLTEKVKVLRTNECHGLMEGIIKRLQELLQLKAGTI